MSKIISWEEAQEVYARKDAVIVALREELARLQAEAGKHDIHISDVVCRSDGTCYKKGAESLEMAITMESLG